jgi:ubiquinone/menaquinone biosynthesis C-methylase UbiE
MRSLTVEEKVNLETFSNSHAVERLYNREGFTELESYLVAKYMEAGGRLLDIGCGTGRTTRPFAEREFDVIGIDLSKDMITFAKNKHRAIDFRVMDACCLEFDEGSFDHVFFSFNGMDYIHPYPNRNKCLTEMRRVLRRGGTLAYSSHNALCLPKNRELMCLFAKNLLNLSLFTGYRIEDSPTGVLHTYYGIPFVEKGRLEKAGFDVLEIRGKTHRDDLLMMLWELSPYYVARKL